MGRRPVWCLHRGPLPPILALSPCSGPAWVTSLALALAMPRPLAPPAHPMLIPLAKRRVAICPCLANS